MGGTVIVSDCKKIYLLLLVVLSTVLIVNYPPDLYGLVSNNDTVEPDNMAHPKVTNSKRANLPYTKPPDLYGLVSNESTAESAINTVHPNVRKSSTAERASLIPILNLPQGVIDGVKKFVFFVGHPRSGHSIVGSFMDAHPHMVIAHEFMLFRQLLSTKQIPGQSTIPYSKADLFNALYSYSAYDSRSGWRSKGSNWKNYTLNVESSWQGKYDRYISVIGDKSGGATSNIYRQSPEIFKARYRQLQGLLEFQ